MTAVATKPMSALSRSLNSRDAKAVGRPPRPSRLSCVAFQIDRRHHMELAWRRQAEQAQVLEALSQAGVVGGGVQEVADLPHLERVLEVSGGALCLVAFYSRSCGICKDVMSDFRELWRDCRRQQSRVVFITHNVLDEFDYPSDVARMYNVRSVPRFLFLVDGAVVRQVSMADTRQSPATRQGLRTRLEEERKLLRQTLWQLLVQHTPSARR